MFEPVANEPVIGELALLTASPGNQMERIERRQLQARNWGSKLK